MQAKTITASIIGMFSLLFSFSVAMAQTSAEPSSTQESFITRMLSDVGRIVDNANIQITTSTLTESDLTKTLKGQCNFFNLTNVGFMAKFDAAGLIRRFEVAVPLGQKLDNGNISSIIKSGDWVQLFVPDDIKRSMVLSKYFINFTNTLTIDSVGVDFSIPGKIPIFGLSALNLSEVGICYKVSNPLSQASLSGLLNATVLWGGNNPVSFSAQSNLVRNPKEWELSFGIGNLSINSLAENLGIDKSLIPVGVNNLLTLTSANLTIKPCAYSFLFNGRSPLGNINLLVKRVSLDNKPVPTDTLSLNTSLTGSYSSAASPPALPADHPDAPPTQPAASAVKNYKWGMMAGFSLPESNDDVQAIRFMRKIGLTNIALVVSTFDDAVETNLPIFANLGSGNTMIQKGISFVAWVPVEDLLTKYKLTQPLRAFAPEFMKALNTANPFKSVMFRANVSATNIGEFNLEGDLNFNDKMALSVKGIEIGKLSNLKLGLGVSPLAQSAEFSFSALWSMLIDPTQKAPLDFAATMFVKPGADASVTMGFSGAMLSNWDNVYGMPGIGFNSLKFKAGLSFSSAIIPIPDDIFFTGQMKYGQVVGDVTMAVNYNELSQNMVLARFCKLSLANVIDQFLGGAVKTKYSSKKNAYVNVLNDFLNLELKDVYFKVVPPNAPTNLMSGLRLAADYTKDSCNTTSLKLGDNWVPGIRMAAEGKFAGWNGYFDVGIEGSLSSLSGGLTVKGKMDPIKISANGFKIFHFSGYKESDPFELFVDLSTNNLIKGVSSLLSGPDAAAMAAGSDRIFYLSGGLTILEAVSAKTLIELTPEGYKFRANGKIYKFVDGTIDATIGSFKDILNTTTVNTQLNIGEIQQKIIDKLGSVLGEIPFFNELKKGFSINSISFAGKLAMLQSSANAKINFKIAGQTFIPEINISMGSSIDFLVNTVVNKIVETAKNAIDFARNAFNEAIRIAGVAAETLKNAAVASYNFAKNTTEQALTTANNLKDKLTSVAKSAINNAKDGFNNAVEKTEQFFKDFGNYTQKTVEKIYNKSIGQIKNGWESFTSTMKKAFTGSDNEERIMTDGPAFRVITKYQNQVLAATLNIKSNWPVVVRPRTDVNNFLETWQLVPNDRNDEGSFYLVSGYNALLITKPWPTHTILIPHESDHKDRERMLMEQVPGEPGWYYLKFRDFNNNGYTYIELKTVQLSDVRNRPGFQANIPQMVLAPVNYSATNRPGDMGKFKFEKAGDIDWINSKNLPPTMVPAVPFVEGSRYKFNLQAEQYIYSNGKFRWIPDLETLAAAKFDTKPLIELPDNQRVSTVLGTPYPSRKDGILIQAQNDPAVYIMDKGFRRWIPDINTLSMMGLTTSLVNSISIADLKEIPLGAQIPVNFKPMIVLQEKALYQVPGDPTVYVVQDNMLRGIPDPETLGLMGYTFAQVHSINTQELASLKKGTILPVRTQNSTLQVMGKTEIYMMDKGIRRLTPDPATRKILNIDLGKVQKISQEDMNLIPVGPAITSMK